MDRIVLNVSSRQYINLKESNQTVNAIATHEWFDGGRVALTIEAIDE
jgi:hypothetical protein